MKCALVFWEEFTSSRVGWLGYIALGQYNSNPEVRSRADHQVEQGSAAVA